MSVCLRASLSLNLCFDLSSAHGPATWLCTAFVSTGVDVALR